MLPSRSLSLDGEVESTVKRDLSKEEEILEKSRQMIEESQAKNELLAEQVRLFLKIGDESFSLSRRFIQGESLSTNIATQ